LIELYTINYVKEDNISHIRILNLVYDKYSEYNNIKLIVIDVQPSK